MVLGPTPGEQYLAWIGLEDHPVLDEIARELDDEILFVCEQVIRDRKRDDPLLRALLHEDCQTHAWATYPVGGLPVGTSIRYVVDPDFPRRYTVQGKVRAATVWDRDDKGPFITWESARYEPRLVPDDLVEAWVPIPIDLTALADHPEPAATTPPARPAVTWDDLAVGQVIRFWYHNRSQRLSGRPAKSYLARVRKVCGPDHAYPQLGLEVLKADLTRNQTIGFHTLHCGPQYGGLQDVIEIVHRGPAPAVEPQDLTAL